MGPVLYMLEAYEELYIKELDPLVEEILRCHYELMTFTPFDSYTIVYKST